jgi:aminoglycoside phosphotransferase (APT) family kinase protein
VSDARAAPALVEVLPNHRFDEAALKRYLNGRVPGFDGDITVRQFQGGQSNPTYHVQTAAGAYVLRKKPGGKLLPSAHAVDREYRVMKALQGTGVPVPVMRLLCEDESVIGQMFFLMDHVPGRVPGDPLLPGLDAAERRETYLEGARVVAKLRGVDWRAAGLEGFGKPEGYVARQLARWQKQYEAGKVEENEHMAKLAAWLAARVPVQDEAVIAHGDSRIGNMIFAFDSPKVLALLDWELATIGHPLGDLSYMCMVYYMPADDPRGFRGQDYRALGIPSEDELKQEYCRAAGRGGLPDWDFFMVFSLYRIAAIRAGIYKRAIDGNAANRDALQVGTAYRGLAATAWALANGERQA